MEVLNNQNDPSAGTRRVSLGPVIYLERSDFNEVSCLLFLFVCFVCVYIHILYCSSLQ